MIICTFSGIRYHVNPAPPRLRWPHPALAYGFDFPKGNPAQSYLRFAAALFAMHNSYPQLVQTASPLNKEAFSPRWLQASYQLLSDLHQHLQGCGTDRLKDYPTIVLSKHTTSIQLEYWLTHCTVIADEYKQLSTAARDIANTKHALMIRARNRAITESASNSRTFVAYIERCAVDCTTDHEGQYQFLRVCKNPQGCTETAIRNTLNLLHDWAPQESVDDQLDFDTLIQRLEDSLLDARHQKAAREQRMNVELSRGLFRVGADANPTQPAQKIKEHMQSAAMTELQKLLAKVEALNSTK